MQCQRDTNKQTWTLKGRCKWSVRVFSCVYVLFSSSCSYVNIPVVQDSIQQMTLLYWHTLQARDEEKNRRNNKDSTNQVMKDLEDLLPNKSLIPPPTEEEQLPPPGTHTHTHTHTQTHTHTHLHIPLLHMLAASCIWLSLTFFLLFIHLLRCCSWEGPQVSQNKARCRSKRG